MSTETKDNIGKAMASVYIEYKPVGEPDAEGKRKIERHEEVINVATIQSRLGSDFRITGIDSVQEAHRITSYNVCYTKLLRFSSHLRRLLCVDWRCSSDRIVASCDCFT